MFFYMREQFSQEEKHLTELKQPCSHLSSPSSFFIYWKPQRFIVFHFKYSLYVPKSSSESNFSQWAFCSVLAIWSWWWLTPLSFVLCFGRRESLGMTLRSICTSEQETFPPCGSKFPSHNWVFMSHHMFGRGPWWPSAWHPNKSFRFQPKPKLYKMKITAVWAQSWCHRTQTQLFFYHLMISLDGTALLSVHIQASEH